MAQRLFTPPGYQFLDNSGNPLAFGKIYFYDSGTTNPRDVYSDIDGLVNIGPVVTLDTYGRRTIYLDLSTNYRVVVKDQYDVAIPTYNTIDNYAGIFNAVSEVMGSSGLVFADDTGINEANGKKVYVVGTNPSAVNYLKVTPGSASSAVVISTNGSDSNIQLDLDPKGSGIVRVVGSLTATTSVTTPQCIVSGAVSGATIAASGALSGNTLAVASTSTFTGGVTHSSTTNTVGNARVQAKRLHDLNGAFYAYRTTGQTITGTGDNGIIFPTERFDVNSWYNTSTGLYTPQQPGYYRISAGVNIGPASAASLITLKILKNGLTSYATCRIERYAGGSYAGPVASAIIDLNGSTDYVQISIAKSSGTDESTLSNAGDTFFCGELVVNT